MSEGRLTNVWCYSPSPPPSAIDPWLAECYSGSNHYIVSAATQRAAQDQFLREHPELRGVVRWIFEAPPQPTSGPIAFVSPSSAGVIAPVLAYNASDCLVAPER